MPDLSTAITEVLAAHGYRIEHDAAGSGLATIVCVCGNRYGFGATHLAHQSAMLAPVTREAQAVALEGYFKSVERIDECIHGLVDPDDSWLDFREAHNEFANDYVPLSPLSEVTNAVYYAKYRAKKLREES